MKLSEEQNRAASSLEGPNMVLAVPGAGKTTILLKRIEKLIKKGVQPERILTISFSKAAATELKTRFLRGNHIKGPTPHFYTIHAFSYMIVRDYARKKGLDYKLLEGSTSISKYKLIADIYFEIHRVYIPEERLEAFVNRIGYLKNMMLQPKDLEDEFDRFEEIYKKYEDYKSKYKYIDFDDMLELSLKILKEDRQIRSKYIQKYDYIQVDEGQDTSKLQIEIIKVLTKTKKNLYLVADDDQSIYSFRGADPQGLFDLEKFFPDLTTHYMETNFRCSKNIVLAANNFISQNKMRYSKNLRSSKDYLSPVEFVKVQRVEDQYRFILDDLKQKGLKFEDVGILYRNNVSALGLIEYFEREDIPFTLKESSKIKFFDHRIAQDILDIIEFSQDFSRYDLFSRFFYKINGYISKYMIAQAAFNKEGNVFQALMNVPGLKTYNLKELKTLEEDFKTLNKLAFKDKLSFIEGDLGYESYLSYLAKKETLGLQGEVLVYSVLKKISSLCSSSREFVGRLRYLDSLAKSKTGEGINLSTVHSAKGKEYKQVYLVDVYQGMFPINKKGETSPVQVEEERRLFYVAMTRAKDYLNILFPSRVGREETEVSDFLIELQKSCK